MDKGDWNEKEECSFKKERGTVEIVGYDKSAKSLSIKGKVKIAGYSFTVVSIANNAFKNCSKLKGTVNIPGTVTGIGTSAFYGCKKITTVVIGKKVKSIGSKAFYKCSSLKVIDFSIAGKINKVGEKAFKKVCKSCVIIMPKGRISYYSEILKGKY